MFKRTRHCQQCGGAMPTDIALAVQDLSAIEMLLWVVLGMVCVLESEGRVLLAAGLVGGGLVLALYLFGPLPIDHCRICRDAEAGTLEKSNRHRDDQACRDQDTMR